MIMHFLVSTDYFSVEEIKQLEQLGNDIIIDSNVIEVIKDFDHRNLTEEQELLTNKIILDERLKGCYKEYGLCEECKQPLNHYWCRICNFQQNFQDWTSGNDDIDKFIQKAQLKATQNAEVLEWIEYNRFEDVEYLANEESGTTYKAIWKDGPIICWDFENNKWKRDESNAIALKYLHNSQDITETLSEVRYFL